MQIPIKAGHEFIVSTEDKYAKIGDDKIIYMDYVRSIFATFRILAERSLLAEKPPEGHCAWEAHLRR